MNGLYHKLWSSHGLLTYLSHVTIKNEPYEQKISRFVRQPWATYVTVSRHIIKRGGSCHFSLKTNLRSEPKHRIWCFGSLCKCWYRGVSHVIWIYRGESCHIGVSHVLTLNFVFRLTAYIMNLLPCIVSWLHLILTLLPYTLEIISLYCNFVSLYDDFCAFIVTSLPFIVGWF